MKLSTLFFALMAYFVQTTNAQTKPVEIQGAVGILRGFITIPANSDGKKLPVVIIFHGFTGNKNEKIHIALTDSLAARGIASIRFDFNGHGESDGAMRGMSIDNEVEDARRIVGFAESLPFIGKIGIFGHSQGGVVSILLSSELGKKQIKTVALLAPALMIHDNLLQGICFGTRFDPLNVPEEVSVFDGKVTLGRNYILAGQGLRLFEAAKKYKGDVIAIHGTGDRSVPYSCSQYLPYFYKRCELSLIPGADHTFTDFEGIPAGIVAVWMDKKLK